jgi:SRSO17 transposase
VITAVPLENLKMMATALVLGKKFRLSEISRMWLKEKSVNAFSHFLAAARLPMEQMKSAYYRMLQKVLPLTKGFFIIDDTLEHHSKMCRFIFGVQKHFDHVLGKMVKAECLVFLYYSLGVIKFPIGWRIYYRNSGKTKNELALELVAEGLRAGFGCEAVLADAWYCVSPFIAGLQELGVNYIFDLKTNATIDVPVGKKRAGKKRGRKRSRWYRKVNVVEYFKRLIWGKDVGFAGDVETGKREAVLYRTKEAIRKIHALPGSHKLVMTYNPKRHTTKYLITNVLEWEALKVIKSFYERWNIEEFFQNVKQLFNLEGAMVRGEQAGAIKLLLVSYCDALLHLEVVKIALKNPQSAPVTVQSIVRLAMVENAERFVKLVGDNNRGKSFLERWIGQLKEDTFRKRIQRSPVICLSAASC